MKNIAAYFVIILFLLSSCHSNSGKRDSINHDAQLIDSVKHATEQEIANRIEIARRNNVRIRIHDSLIADCNKKITRLYSEIEVQNMKLADIKKFHLFRTPANKEMQVRNQINLINAMSTRITRLKDSLHYFDTNY